MPELLYTYYVYILSNKHRTTFYIGVTNDIRRRILEHKAGVGSVFTKRYNLNDLLYSEDYDFIQQAIAREKQLKNWKREWKLKLIRDINPEMKDGAADWFSEEEIRNFRAERLRGDSDFRQNDN